MHGRSSGWDLQCAGCQVGVLVLQLAIQCQATLLPVVGQEWCQSENLAESGAGCHQITADRGRKRAGGRGCMGTRPRPGLVRGTRFRNNCLPNFAESSDLSPRLMPGSGLRLNTRSYTCSKF